MHLKVEEANIEQVLGFLSSNAWQVPKFQRDFVWTESQVIGFIDSILRARPIGMTTLWAQADDQALPLEPVSIPDWNNKLGKTSPKYFANNDQRPNTYYAILDGRQRCTSIAMVFGGLHPDNGNYRFAGRFYLNVAEKDPTRRIIFVKNKDIQSQGLDTRSICIGKGLFPLSVEENSTEGLFGQWMDYIQAIKDPKNYADNKLPDDEELKRREQVLREAFRGINSTKLAVYIVPSEYNLDEICEIFETLNTTGTKVSTVDLIHSMLYSETQSDSAEPLNLRDWMSDVSQLDGATGWINPDSRPELTAQIVTACYVALENKPKPRKRPGASSKNINSVKSSDLLATPAQHWRDVVQKQEYLANFIGDFQKTTAEGYYPMSSCPYPISGAIYVGLRWYKTFDGIEAPWGIDDLNALFSAFFWRNALTNRYDQGFLTQLGADLIDLKSILNNRAEFDSNIKWAEFAQAKLDEIIESPLPSREVLMDYLTSGKHRGAMQKALLLPLVARATQDPLDPEKSLRFPDHETVEMHHIYPQTWCKNNASGTLYSVLDEKEAGRNYRESVVNLLPISRTSNQRWKAKIPGQAINEVGLKYEHLSDILSRQFIDKKLFDILTSDNPDPASFWNLRAELMADYFISRFNVRL